MRNIVQEDNKLVQQQVNKSDALLTFCLKIRNREDNMADDAYAVLELCMLLEISETHTKILLQQELHDVHFFLSCNSSPWKAVTHQKILAFQWQISTYWIQRASQSFLNLSSNSTTDHKCQKLYMSSQNIVMDKSLILRTQRLSLKQQVYLKWFHRDYVILN
jgi:hypothetical protein